MVWIKSLGKTLLDSARLSKKEKELLAFLREGEQETTICGFGTENA
jgi:hypothetical protein